MFACRQIVFNGIILSTDDYFVNHQGIYRHESRFVQQAHMWNQQRGVNLYITTVKLQYRCVHLGLNCYVTDNMTHSVYIYIYIYIYIIYCHFV